MTTDDLLARADSLIATGIAPAVVRDLVAEVRALTARLDAAHELVRASGALLCDYREERGIWWEGFREALAGMRSSLGLTPDLTDTDLRAATADPTPCSTCHGRQRVWDPDDGAGMGAGMYRPCPDCADPTPHTRLTIEEARVEAKRRLDALTAGPTPQTETCGYDTGGPEPCGMPEGHDGDCGPATYDARPAAKAHRADTGHDMALVSAVASSCAECDWSAPADPTPQTDTDDG